MFSKSVQVLFETFEKIINEYTASRCCDIWRVGEMVSSLLSWSVIAAAVISQSGYRTDSQSYPGIDPPCLLLQGAPQSILSSLSFRSSLFRRQSSLSMAAPARVDFTQYDDWSYSLSWRERALQAAIGPLLILICSENDNTDAIKS